MKVDKINKQTGGIIAEYTFQDDNPFDKETENIIETIPNSFMSIFDNTYIGNYKRGEWYVQNRLIVYKDFPCGVAIALNKAVREIKEFSEYLRTGYIDDKHIKNIVAYSHRAASCFTLGDRIFDPNYEPIAEDYSKSDWKFFQDNLKKAKANSTDSDDYRTLKSTMSFNNRGKEIIRNWDDAIKAAINLYNYIA